ncbi:MAG: 2OG-Fe(II) oxygenase family protein [Pseudomonadota bacterium]
MLQPITQDELDARASRLSQDGCLQMQDILAEDLAVKLHKTLAELEWVTVFNKGNDNYEMPRKNAMAMSEEDRQRLLSQIQQRARSHYQFFYLRYPVLEPYFDGDGDRGPLAGFFEMMNSKKTLDIVRQIVGEPDICWADGQATCFGPGHFLNQHDDSHDTHQRVAAYVLNLTPKWDEDWGGYLQFFDEQGDMTGGFRPRFNALNMFSVPNRHSVELVAPYAGALRYSITGWFRKDDPPGKIGGEL